jgi:hypothetical protein
MLAVLVKVSAGHRANGRARWRALPRPTVVTAGPFTYLHAALPRPPAVPTARQPFPSRSCRRQIGGLALFGEASQPGHACGREDPRPALRGLGPTTSAVTLRSPGHAAKRPNPRGGPREECGMKADRDPPTCAPTGQSPRRPGTLRSRSRRFERDRRWAQPPPESHHHGPDAPFDVRGVPSGPEAGWRRRSSTPPDARPVAVP